MFQQCPYPLNVPTQDDLILTINVRNANLVYRGGLMVRIRKRTFTCPVREKILDALDQGGQMRRFANQCYHPIF